jgi:hypothetical protein
MAVDFISLPLAVTGPLQTPVTAIRITQREPLNLRYRPPGSLKREAMHACMGRQPLV